MSNKDVARLWSEGKSGRNAHLFTTGESIYSYGLLIGYTEGKMKIAIDYTAVGGDYISQTTSYHVSSVKCYSNEVKSSSECRKENK